MSSFKGVLGETVINVAMWLKLDKETYHRLNNVTLPLSNGGSTQIDHVIVSKYGIFVIETKNYKGWIYGNEKQRQWTQAFANGSKFKFQNPLRQNYLHIKTLADLLTLDMSYFHSMITFIGECELKTRDELPEQVLTGGMAPYVKKKQEVLLTDEEVKYIVEEIENHRFSKSWRTNKNHKAYLKDRHSSDSKTPTAKPTSDADANDKMVSSQTLEASLILKPKGKEILKSREVPGWSGQTQLASEPFVVSTDINQEIFYITPFAFDNFQSETLIKTKTDDPTIDESIEEKTEEVIASKSIPSCPKCHSEMVKRVARKGQRQGEIFYGCSQFPKCRGVVNS